jgi:hypothetical protein
MVMLNAFAYKATDPRDMKRCENPVGVFANDAIRDVCKYVDEVLVCWGAHASYCDRDREVIAILRSIGVKPKCLGLTKHGKPRHPLLMRNDTAVVAFSL